MESSRSRPVDKLEIGVSACDRRRRLLAADILLNVSMRPLFGILHSNVENEPTFFMKWLIMVFDFRACPSRSSFQAMSVLLALLLLGLVGYSPVVAENLDFGEFEHGDDEASGYQTTGEQSSLMVSISFAGMVDMIVPLPCTAPVWI